MNDQWAVAIVGFGFVALCSILGAIAKELYGIRISMSKLVHKDECNYAMGNHCKRIDDLEKSVEQMRIDMAVYHGK